MKTVVCMGAHLNNFLVGSDLKRRGLIMVKNINFIFACIIISAIAWGFFQIFGQYTFLIMLIITIALLLAKAGKAKFGNKK